MSENSTSVTMALSKSLIMVDNRLNNYSTMTMVEYSQERSDFVAACQGKITPRKEEPYGLTETNNYKAHSHVSHVSPTENPS